jgi:hypothetical protein
MYQWQQPMTLINTLCSLAESFLVNLVVPSKMIIERLPSGKIVDLTTCQVALKGPCQVVSVTAT